MNKRHELLFFANHLSDDRIHRVFGKCIAEGSRQNVAPEPETVTQTDCTRLAALLPKLPSESIDHLLWLAQGMNEASSEQLTGINLLLSLRPDYAHMVKVFAQSLHDAQEAINHMPTEGEAI